MLYKYCITSPKLKKFLKLSVMKMSQWVIVGVSMLKFEIFHKLSPKNAEKYFLVILL